MKKLNLDHFDTVMSVTKREGRWFIFPGEYLPGGKDLKVEVGPKPSATLVSAYHNEVKKAYEREQEQAIETGRQRVADAPPAGEEPASPARGRGVEPAAPEDLPSIEEVLQARLDSAKELSERLEYEQARLSSDIAANATEIAQLTAAMEAMNAATR